MRVRIPKSVGELQKGLRESEYPRCIQNVDSRNHSRVLCKQQITRPLSDIHNHFLQQLARFNRVRLHLRLSHARQDFSSGRKGCRESLHPSTVTHKFQTFLFEFISMV